MRNVWRRLRSFVLHPSRLGPRLKGAVTLMAFTDSGWMRRFRVPRLAVTLVAALLVALTVATILSVSFAVWAGADLRRLTAWPTKHRLVVERHSVVEVRVELGHAAHHA